MSALSDRLSDADLDAIARILHAGRERRAERERALQESTAGGDPAGHRSDERDE